jgi:hypothetical protein
LEVSVEALDTLVTRELIVEREDRSRQPIVVRIGKPYWVSENVEAACPLQIDGLYSKLADVRGVDLYQAVQLAMQLAETLLQSAALKKHRLLWPSGERYDSTSKTERKAPQRARKKAKNKRFAPRKK